MSEPAFPCDFETGRVVEFDEQLDHNRITQLLEKRSGMSLRDYFAAKAMQGFLGNREFQAFIHDGAEIAAELLASNAYQVADAMLKERDAK